MKGLIGYLTALLCINTAVSAQDQVFTLANPSFEEIPHKGGNSKYDIGISGWYDCGKLMFPNETPPDIHPVDFWEVTHKASHGNTYLGLVIRDNDSWESVSQRLTGGMIEANKCYEFNIDLARAPKYISGSKITKQIENYNRPAVLRIWGGTGVCGQQELLGESEAVTNANWETYNFKFEPGKNLNYITIEAFYRVPVLIPYNGHLLLDNAGEIRMIPCDDTPLLAAAEKLPEAKTSDTKKVTATKPKPSPARAEPAPSQSAAELAVEDPRTPKREKLLKELEKPLTEGQIIRVHSIYFQADSSTIMAESMQALEEIYEFLKMNKNVIIEIGGHTNTVPSSQICNQLSTARARAVALTLVRKGISPNRVQYRGYGKSNPIIRNDKYDFDARQKNQRVEIKILSIS